MTRAVEADYLVVGAGAMGMAFTDALIDHADVRVALVDRRPAAGGHWLHAYPFVRLHQSSTFYGVASTVLGGGRIQQQGPEAGLHERADQPTICAYYDRLLADRMVGSGRVEFHAGCEYLGDRTFEHVESGQRFEVPQQCRVVDARYLAPDIPAETPPKFAVSDGVRVIPVNDLVGWEETPSQYVIVGSGKTATDACVWLLQRGVDPDAMCWVRPRDPWMLNRALIQPDPVIYLGMVADMMRSAAASSSLPDLFLRLEEAGTMLRIDRSVTPTMAKAPTLGTWELDLLRTIENVVRLGHIDTVRRGRIDLADGSVAIADDALVVNCAADGLKNPPRVPIWRPGGDHPAAGPGRVPLLRGGAHRVRRGDPEQRRREERAVRALVVRQLADRLGHHERPGDAELGGLRRRARHQGVVRPGRPQPRARPPGPRASPELDEAVGRLRANVPAGLARLAELS